MATASHHQHHMKTLHPATAPLLLLLLLATGQLGSAAAQVAPDATLKQQQGSRGADILPGITTATTSSAKSLKHDSNGLSTALTADVLGVAAVGAAIRDAAAGAIGSVVSDTKSIESSSSSSSTGGDDEGGIEINSSIMILGRFDWMLYEDGSGRTTSRCIQMVLRSTPSLGSRINFVPTHYWMDKARNGVVDSFCFMHNYTDDGKGECLPFDVAAIADFREGMQRCFQAALDVGYSIAVTPHLDDGQGQHAWRNGLAFDPLQKYGGHSYNEVMLQPLAQALSAAGWQPTSRVWLAMQGEMSATVVRYPNSYAQLAPQLKALIAEGKGEGAASRVKIGVSLNFNRLDDVSSGSASGRLSWLMWLLGVNVASGTVPRISKHDIRELFFSLDFVGISAYAGLTEHFEPQELGNSAYQFAAAAAELGLSLRKMQEAGIELHYSEFGIGGGINYMSTNMAQSPAQLAKVPYFGVYGPYNRTTDPWQLWRPETEDVPNRTFLRQFWGRASAFFSKAGKWYYPVDAVFIWNLASWDVQGIYPESTTADGSYRDDRVCKMIQQHNAAARARSRASSPVVAVFGRR